MQAPKLLQFHAKNIARKKVWKKELWVHFKTSAIDPISCTSRLSCNTALAFPPPRHHLTEVYPFLSKDWFVSILLCPPVSSLFQIPDFVTKSTLSQINKPDLNSHCFHSPWWRGKAGWPGVSWASTQSTPCSLCSVWILTAPTRVAYWCFHFSLSRTQDCRSSTLHIPPDMMSPSYLSSLDWRLGPRSLPCYPSS